MQIDIERSKEIFLKICGDSVVVQQVAEWLESHMLKAQKLVDKGMKKNWKALLKNDAFCNLCICVAFLPIVKEKYRQKGISDKVFFDTMTDMKIWMDDCQQYFNKVGIKEINWIVHHLDMEIFSLGRLQFQLSKYYFNCGYCKDGVDIKLGDKCLNIHIPRGGSLTPQQCDESISLAKSFFKQYFPQYPTNFFVCHSWLLYSGNVGFAPTESNILKFARRFVVVGENKFPSQTFRWLFGIAISDYRLIANKRRKGQYLDVDKLPQQSSLQRSAIQYLKVGGQFGDAKGILISNDDNK